MNDGSLEINNLALNNCFSYRNVFQNGTNTLSKIGFFFFKKNPFLSKSWKFRVIWTIRFCSNFTSMWSKYLPNNVWRDFKLPISALAMVARKSFNGKFTTKIDFPFGYFILPLLMLTLEVKSLSIHYFISIWTTLVKFEQNHMVRTIQNFEPFNNNKKKKKNG